jgi:hypothetical protein
MSGVKRLRDGMALVKIYRANPETSAVFNLIQDAHSHWEGEWYQRPKAYPVAYFDADGYVVVQGLAQLVIMSIRKVAKIGDTIHFSPALRSLPEWKSVVPPPKDFKR